MEDICVSFLDQVQFFRFLRDVALTTNLVAKMGQNYHPLHLSLSIQNGIGYRLANIGIYSSTNAVHHVKNGENQLSSF